MKRRISTTEIDSFFDQLKEQPAIYNEEKVHQIINSPAAKARLKGKSQNLLKFTIMTTIFAVIVSAVLWWPSHSMEIPNNKNQIPNTVSQTSSTITDLDEDRTSNKNHDSSLFNSLRSMEESKAEANTNTAQPVLCEEESKLGDDKENSVSTDSTTQSNQMKTATTPQQPVQKAIGFDPDTIKPTDGSRFIMKLSNDELRKIGFEVNDTLISYFKCLNGRQFVYSYKSVVEQPWGTRRSDQVFLQVSRTSIPSQGTITIYPSCETNKYFSDLKVVDYFKNEDFDLVNDTLIPIIIPRSTFDPEVLDEILWFSPCPDLLSILSEKHKPIIDEFLKYKQAKQAFPKTDLISYQAPKLIDESKILVLSTVELTKIGFQFYADSTIYKGRKTDAMVEIMKKNGRSKTASSTTEGGMLPGEDGCLAVIVTRQDGSPYMTFGKLIQFLFPNKIQHGSQFPLLIPVLIKSKNSLFEEDVIFWFYPTNAFFNSLPARIRTDLRKEYDYVVAEDKSTLVQSECKYFDECKNTLKVSSFMVYPNPASANATVSFTLPKAINGRIMLVDLAGRERQVLQPQTNFAKGTHRIDIDVSSVPEGIYLLTLYSDQGVQTQRVILAR